MEINFIAEKFINAGKVTEIQTIGTGLINDTYQITTELSGEHDGFILQRINTAVFSEPYKIIQNLNVLNAFVNSHPDRLQINSRIIELPALIPTKTGSDFYQGTDSSFWRALTLIKNSETQNRITGPSMIQQTGQALGCFHRVVREIPLTDLSDPLPDFHDFSVYRKQYEEVLKNRSPHNNSVDEAYCINFFNFRKKSTGMLEDAVAENHLTLSPVHGDPKLENFLFKKNSPDIIGIVDLDTFKPGLIYIDIGDALRSSCNYFGENTTDFDAVYFDLSLFTAFMTGYLMEMGDTLQNDNVEYVYQGIRTMSIELGMRFFTDYLSENTYFGASHPLENLQKTIVQCKLTESIERQRISMKNTILDLLAG